VNWSPLFLKAAPVALKVIDFGFAVAQKAVDWNDARLARKRKAKQWAETPSVIRGCARCNEIAYTPGQVACSKCGGLL